eukprot:8675401-Pyramimonas_sp.AAC.1
MGVRLTLAFRGSPGLAGPSSRLTKMVNSLQVPSEWSSSARRPDRRRVIGRSSVSGSSKILGVEP